MKLTLDLSEADYRDAISASRRRGVARVAQDAPSRGVVTHPQCGRAWSGRRAEHCPVCHETFTNTQIGDAHRTGEHGVTEGPDRRRCRTVVEMRALTIASGVHAGEPLFTTMRDRHTGARIWTRNDPGKRARTTRWSVRNTGYPAWA